MNELLQKHGCANVFTVPEGLKELMADITREVLREQPKNIFDFIANYLSVLIITREHGILAVKILDDLCDCKPSVSEHLVEIGMEKDLADMLAKLIKEQIEISEPVEGKEKVNEMLILKKIMAKVVLDETMATRVCQLVRNAYSDYWYRKKLMEKNLKINPDEPWEIAAERTIALYKKTKPSFTELTRAVRKIQAAYRGYYVRKKLLNHLKPQENKEETDEYLLGSPIDVAESREIDLGPMIDIKVTEDNVADMFDKPTVQDLELSCDTMRTVTHVEDDAFLEAESILEAKSRISALSLAKSLVATRSDMYEHKQSQQIGTFEVEPGVTASPPTSLRQSRVPSIDGPFQSQDMSQADAIPTYHKISFTQTPPKIVAIDDKAEILEDVQETADETEAAAEVPEDIPDDITDEPSFPSTASETANTTDVEEDVSDTTGNEQ